METFVFLAVDGLINGAVYAQVALSLVLIYTVTRVVNIAQGEYAMFGALTLASFLEHRIPSTLFIAVLGLAASGLINAWRKRHQPSRALLALVWPLGAAALLVAMTVGVVASQAGILVMMLASLLLVAALGPIVYHLTVSPIPNAGTIVLVIVSVGVQMVMQGLGLLFWGAKPYPVPPLATGEIVVGPAFVSYQSLWICAISLSMMAGLYLFFELTILGKALRATAVNRRGAQICGIPVALAGMISFFLAAAFSATSGMLVAPIITANYEMGFPLGLRGFVGSTMGGLGDYLLAIVGVLGVGVLESFAAYSVSSFRDAIVFLLIIPVLIWRNRYSAEFGRNVR